MSIIKFRRTFRLHSALDGRPVWVIAYEAPGRRGKPENRRIFFKPSDVMLEMLHEKMPSKVKVTEEDIFARRSPERKNSSQPARHPFPATQAGILSFRP
jgi:hypothetical protein